MYVFILLQCVCIQYSGIQIYAVSHEEHIGWPAASMNAYAHARASVLLRCFSSH